MTRHPGDPRARGDGVIPFDPNEYPRQTYNPPPEPPPVGTDWIPYRGQEYHGTAPTQTPWDYQTLAGEQAVEDYKADGGHPLRSPVEQTPIPVSIVSELDYTQETLERYASYRVSQMVGQTIQLLSYNQARNRFRILLSSSTGVCELLLSDNPQPTTLNSIVIYVNANESVIEYESQAQNALYANVVSATETDATGVYLSIVQEVTRYQGIRLVGDDPGRGRKHRIQSTGQ